MEVVGRIEVLRAFAVWDMYMTVREYLMTFCISAIRLLSACQPDPGMSEWDNVDG